MQVCNYNGCHLKGIAQPMTAFATISNGKPHTGKTCVACLPRKRASNLKTVKGGGKESYNRYQKSAKGIAKARRNDKSEKGLARHKRARNSVVGKATAKRLSKKFGDKCRSEPQYRIPFLIRGAYYAIITGRGAGERFFKQTSFKTKPEFIGHLKQTGVKMSKFGDKWVVEHRIPVAVYDHTDPAEVKKCWSKSNVTTATGRFNNEKGFKIVDEECLKVDKALWPKQWFGVIPTEEQKEAMRVRVMSGQGVF